VYLSGNSTIGHAYQKTVRFLNTNGGVVIQPYDAFKFSVFPGYSRSFRKQDQFVQHIFLGEEIRSIVSQVDQQSFYLSVRGNYYITPNLSVQYYGQPFIFRAVFKNFGVVRDPFHKEYDQRFHKYLPGQISITDRIATVDENQDGQSDFSFFTPDFNFIQFRSNLILRWEYIAGSEIYLVWSQGVIPNAFGDLDTPLVRSLFDNVFDHQPHNIFLVKLSYRFLN
jgi:hypothetical protein